MGLSGEKLIGRIKSPITSTRPGKGASAGENGHREVRTTKAKSGQTVSVVERSGELSGADDRIFPE